MKNAMASGRMLNKVGNALRIAGIPYTGEGYVIETQTQYDDQVQKIIRDVANRVKQSDAAYRKKTEVYSPPPMPEGYKPLAGWVTPDGKLLECKSIYDHLNFEAMPELKIEGVQELLDEVESIAEACQADAERDGNSQAEWHRYEMADSDAKGEIWKMLLKAGFVRLGTRLQELYCEGIPSALIKHNQFLRDTAEGRKMIAKMEPRKFNDPPPDPEYFI